MIAEAEHPLERRQFAVDGRILRSFLHPRIYVASNHGAAHVHYPQGSEKRLQMFAPARLRVTETLSAIDAVIAREGVLPKAGRKMGQFRQSW
jgi:hypothetical protein